MNMSKTGSIDLFCYDTLFVCLSGKTRYNCNMSFINNFPAKIFTALVSSWLLTNFVLKAGSGFDMTFFVFLLIVSFYCTHLKTGLSGVLMYTGLKPFRRRTIIAAAGLAAAVFVLSRLLVVVLQVDLVEITFKQKSVGQMGYQAALAFSPLIASAALTLQTFWVTFFEEFFYRGILLRVIEPYHLLTAQLLQALLFGFVHVAGSLGAGLSVNSLAYLFLYPAMAGLLLGYAYLRTGNNLTLIWTAHFIVNTVSWLVYVNTGVIF